MLGVFYRKCRRFGGNMCLVCAGKRDRSVQTLREARIMVIATMMSRSANRSNRAGFSY